MTALAEVLAHAPRLFAWVLSQRTPRNLERELFLRVVQRGMTVLDVGANVGDHTRLFAVLVGKRGMVHAFEPIPETCKTLRRAVTGTPWIHVHQMAIAEQAATREMTVPAGDTGQASLVVHGYGAWTNSTERETVTVSVGSLDALLRRGDIALPDVIKIDVEGAERLVLQGGKGMLAAHHPILYFEVFEEWTRGFGYAPLDLLRDVEALGYTGCLLLDETLHALPGASSLTTWPVVGSANVLALPPTPLGREARRRLAPLLGAAGYTHRD
jgi:FkbM family methyltransferase